MGNRWLNSGTAVGISTFILSLTGCQRQPETKTQPLAQIETHANDPANRLPKREPIFFLKGDATLSPGAITKLKLWVDTWGLNGKWTLACPSGPGLSFDLLERRVLAIRAELKKNGLAKVETTLLPPEPVGKYDVIYVVKGPP